MLPLIVSYPRSGHNWICRVLERASGHTFLFKDHDYQSGEFKPYSAVQGRVAWMHTHGMFPDSAVYGAPTILLTRNPVDVMFSWIEAIVGHGTQTREELFILYFHTNTGAFTLPKHHAFWSKRAQFEIHYEDFVRDPQASFLNLYRMIFGQDPDARSLDNAITATTKQELIAAVAVAAPEAEKRTQYFHPGLVHPSYEERRREFHAQYGDHIRAVMLPLIVSYPRSGHNWGAMV